MNNERRYVLKYNKKQIELMVKHLSRASTFLSKEVEMRRFANWPVDNLEEEHGSLSFIIDTLNEKIGEE